MTRMGCWGRQPEEIAAQETRGEHLALILSHSRIGYRAGGQGKVRARGPRKGGGRLTGFQGARAGWTRAANCCNLQNFNAQHIVVIFGVPLCQTFAPPGSFTQFYCPNIFLDDGCDWNNFPSIGSGSFCSCILASYVVFC